MITFINTKHEKLDVQTNIDKYSWKYYRISYYIKLIFIRIVIPTFIIISQLFHVKNVCKNVKDQHV